MTKSEYELACIRKSQEEFNELVKRSQHEEIAQCAKLLAMHIALYKKHYGEITSENYLQMLETEPADSELSNIIQDGIEEASAMLSIIITERQHQQMHNDPPSSFIN